MIENKRFNRWNTQWEILGSPRNFDELSLTAENLDCKLKWNEYLLIAHIENALVRSIRWYKKICFKAEKQWPKLCFIYCKKKSFDGKLGSNLLEFRYVNRFYCFSFPFIPIFFNPIRIDIVLTTLGHNESMSGLHIIKIILSTQ